MFTLPPSTFAPRTYALWGLVLLLGLLDRHDLVRPPPVDTSSERQREREREQALQERQELEKQQRRLMCRLIGCFSGAHIRLQVPPSLQRSSPRVRVCLNGRCTEGPHPPGGQLQDCDFLPGPSHCSWDLRGTEPVLELFVYNGKPKDGDIYSVRVHDPTRKVKARAFTQKAVTYSGKYRTGPDCGPACFVARVDG